MSFLNDNRGIVPLALLLMAGVVILILIVATLLLQVIFPLIVFILGILLAIIGLAGLVNLRVVSEVLTLGLEFDRNTSIMLLIFGILLMYFGAYQSDLLFAVTQPFSIVGSIGGTGGLVPPNIPRFEPPLPVEPVQPASAVGGSS